jgi:hypothetical protein
VTQVRRTRRWRPGLDLVNLGLLILGAIVLSVLWTGGTIQRWIPDPWYPALRWSTAILFGLALVLDVVFGVDLLIDGVRRGSQNRAGDPPGEGPRGER